MKNVVTKLSLCISAAALVLTGCSTSNNVVGHGIIQKRKHTGGIFINTRGKAKQGEDLAHKTELKAKTPIVERETVAGPKTEAKAAVLTEKTVRVIASSEAAPAPEIEVVSGDVQPAKQATVVRKSTSAAKTVHKAEARQMKKDLRQELRLKKKSDHSSAAGNSGAMFVLIVIITILLPPLGVLIYTNIDWLKVLISLLLTLLFYLPGLIYSLLVIFDVL